MPKEKMTIVECQQFAIDNGNVIFDFVGPAGRGRMTFVDAEKGIVKWTDKDKQISIFDKMPCGKRTVDFPQFYCENIEVLNS